MISQRTEAALPAAKARGVKLGNPWLHPGDRRATRVARQAHTANAAAHAVADLLPYSKPRVPPAARRLASSRAP
jgi:hypothetical protein